MISSPDVVWMFKWKIIVVQQLNEILRYCKSNKCLKIQLNEKRLNIQKLHLDGYLH